MRDAGGADLGLAMAVERGLIAGPRILFAGRGLSQTGGHGDMRSQTRFEPCGCAAYHGAGHAGWRTGSMRSAGRRGRSFAREPTRSR